MIPNLQWRCSGSPHSKFEKIPKLFLKLLNSYPDLAEIWKLIGGLKADTQYQIWYESLLDHQKVKITFPA